MSIDYRPWELKAANGCVPDLTVTKGWPNKKTGHVEKPEDTIIRSIEDNGSNSALRLPELVIYEHIDFGGHSVRTNLNWYFVGKWWNDKVSSIIVASGTWRFYEHWHYEGRYWDLTPGYYRWVEDEGIPNDLISSFQVVSF